MSSRQNWQVEQQTKAVIRPDLRWMWGTQRHWLLYVRWTRDWMFPLDHRVLCDLKQGHQAGPPGLMDCV